MGFGKACLLFDVVTSVMQCLLRKTTPQFSTVLAFFFSFLFFFVLQVKQITEKENPAGSLCRS